MDGVIVRSRVMQKIMWALVRPSAKPMAIVYFAAYRKMRFLEGDAVAPLSARTAA
jgi:hypothetical protein